MNRWNECLDLIRQQINDEWVVDTWFECITCESFDAETHVLQLGVPSKYVVEFVEHYYVRLLKQVITRVYGEGVTLQYHLDSARGQVPGSANSIEGSARYLSPDSTNSPDGSARYLSPGIPDMHVANARERLQKGLQHFLGDDARWLPEYDEIADWLADNKGRGLLLVGTSGLGKSLICQKILPVVLSDVLGIAVDVVSAREMGQQIDSLVQSRCVIIDDLGHEPVTEMVAYRKRTPFFELCDAAEQRGILLIINTTLSTNKIKNPLYPRSIQERYGNEVLDRLRATTRVVELRGQSMRK